jgi:nucleoside-triphosphatase
MKNVLVTGKPGVGKTSVVEAVAREFPQVGGGFTTSEIRWRGVRKGFRITALDGKSAVLAHINLAGRVRVGKYGVDVPAFQPLALPALEDAVFRSRLLCRRPSIRPPSCLQRLWRNPISLQIRSSDARMSSSLS